MRLPDEPISSPTETTMAQTLLGIPRSQTKVPALPMPNKTTYFEPPILLLSGVGAYGACQTPCSCRLTRCLSTHNLILPHLRRDSRTAVPRRAPRDMAQISLSCCRCQFRLPVVHSPRPCPQPWRELLLVVRNLSTSGHTFWNLLNQNGAIQGRALHIIRRWNCTR